MHTDKFYLFAEQEPCYIRGPLLSKPCLSAKFYIIGARNISGCTEF